MIFDGLSMIAHVYISVLKRGTVSLGFINKVQHGIQADLNKNISINAQAIKIFYNQYGVYLNDVNVPLIVTHWAGLMPQIALRLRLVVQQAANSGLTCLITIGRAFKYFPEFDWRIVRSLYPDELAAIIAAMTVVGDNVYYGFKYELGPVKSTLYKSYGYVAKEVLIKLRGERSLAQYAGWPRMVANQAAVDQLIANFEAYRTNLALRPDEVEEKDEDDHKSTAQVRELVTLGAHVYAG